MSYSQRLLQQGSSLTRLAHQSRFSRVLDLIRRNHYTQALDYGCGDGWLLRSAYDQGLVSGGLGVDTAAYMLAACYELFSDVQGFQFCRPEDVANKIAPHSCDLAVCTETLEHVIDPEAVLEQILSYCKSEAHLIISVPIEVGPSLLVKQTGRYLANLKGAYGYERYTPQELFAATVLWDATRFPSSHSIPGDEISAESLEEASGRGHKGFDYRKIEQLLQRKVTIQQRLFSPFPLLGNLFNSTVIWICRLA